MKASLVRRARSLVILLFFLFGFLVFLYWGIPGSNLPEKSPAMAADGVESCLNCHSGMTGFAPAHDPRAIGCASCHGGDPVATEAEEAHRNMILIPGNLSDVRQTCGSVGCHGDITGRIEQSLMTTMAGVVTVDRFVFGETDTLTGYAHIEAIGHSPADQHLRHLCASCHLGNTKTEFGPVHEKSRGGGCNACHLNYSEAALASLELYRKDRTPKVHPALNLQVTNDHCFGCHSRSGRISTNYEGWHETQLLPEEVAGQEGYRLLEDGRIFRYVAPDVHHTAGLECIDCHTSQEIMGDGNIYLHEEDAVKTRCEDCHSPKPLPRTSYAGLDEESKKIISLRGLPYEGYQYALNSGDVPLLNILIAERDEAFLLGKNDKQKHPLKAPPEICSRPAHDALTCSACHTEWAPQCVGCHNTYDKGLTAFDLLDQQRTTGKWEEYLGEFFAEAPTLGVVEALDTDSQRIRQIKTFIPGMIMTIDQSGFPDSGKDLSFHRLFAPVAPHTTNAGGRSCQSCHNDPLALGYGRGELILSQKSPAFAEATADKEFKSMPDRGTRKGQNYKGAQVGQWTFIPEYVTSEYDGLPQDAWTGFLQERSSVSTTRPNARPFSVAEQQRILTVGACLTCHKEDSEVMLRSLDGFEAVLREVTEECVVPEF